MRQVSLVVGDATDVGQLRRTLARHPVHQWVSAPMDQTVLLVHQAMCHWGSATLAARVGITGPERHFRDTRQGLRRRGAGPCVEAFAEAVNSGVHPVDALAQAGGPRAAQPLVETTWAVATSGNVAALLGALAVGMPCCIPDVVGARDRLDHLIERVSEAAADADASARAVLAAKAALLDGALDVIRRRHMALHPSAWRPPRPAT